LQRAETAATSEAHPFIYAITRRDLSFEQRAVQLGHALIQLGIEHPLPAGIEHPSIILCEVKNETQLRNWIIRLNNAQIKHSHFCEPDLQHQLTAIACTPVYGDQRHFFRTLQLLKATTPKEAAHVG